MGYKKAILFIFATLMLIFTSLLPVRVCAQDTEAEIYLEGATDAASGIFILKIMLLPQDISLCGLELDVIYDPAAMTVCSCERGDALKSLDFDCSLGESRIRLLLWGEENSENGGRIATLCFLPVGDYDGEIEFTLSLPTKTSAIYFDNNKILSQDVSLSGLRVDLNSSALPTDSIIEYPTESPSEPGQENPSAETPTEGNTEECLSGAEPDINPPHSKGDGIFQKILGILLFVSTVASVLSFLPIFFPRVFWKGYF